MTFHPHTWAIAKLGEVLDFKYGKSLTKQTRSGEGYPVFGSSGQVGENAVPLTDGPTIIIGRKGSIGEVSLSETSCWPIDTTYFVDCVPDSNFRYWYYLLRQLDLKSLNKATAIPGLNREDAYRLEIPLAPLNEQKRIADKLDQTLAIVERAKARLARVPEILKQFRQSVLAAATDGRLTEDWRQSLASNNNANLGEWNVHRLGEICISGRVITYGVIKLGDEIKDGVPCLRTSNVRWLRIDTSGIKKIAPGLSAEYSRTILQGSEVLVNVRGTLGGVSVVTDAMVGWNVSREVAVVPVDSSKVFPSYLAYLIGSEETQRWLGGVEKGVAYVGINIEDLRNLPVKTPPLKEQQEIVRRVETLLALADRIQARYQAISERVDKLTQSLLAKAFRGELVSQDPNDEPASELLARISATRALSSSSTTNRKPSMRKSVRAPKENATMTKSRQDEEVKDKPYLAGHLRLLGGSAVVETLFKASELPVTDFYKQLAWEVERGYVRDGGAVLEACDAA